MPSRKNVFGSASECRLMKKIISSFLNEKSLINMITTSISALAYMFEYPPMIPARQPHMSFRKSIMRISSFATLNGRWWTSMQMKASAARPQSTVTNSTA